MNEFFTGKDAQLIEIQIRGEKKNKIAEIYVDSELGIDLEKLSLLSKGINEIADKEGISEELLKIVVSSPGVENPFKYLWQLKKHINRILEYSEDGKIIIGKLINVDEDSEELTIEISDKKREIEVCKSKFYKLDSIKVKLPF